MIWSDILVLIFSLILIVLVMLQTSAEDATSALSGEKTDLFKNRKLRGFDLFLNRSTIIVAFLFFIFVIVSNSLDIRW